MTHLRQLYIAFGVSDPCVLCIYLHPDDHARLRSVHEIITEDAKRALNATLAEWNGKGRLLKRNSKPKTYRIAQKDWSIDLFADMESSVPPRSEEHTSELQSLAYLVC